MEEKSGLEKVIRNLLGNQADQGIPMGHSGDTVQSSAGEEAEDAPAVRLVNELIREAYKNNASDIHVEPGQKRLVIRMRMNGSLVVHTTMDMAFHRPVVTRIKLMAGMDIGEKRLPQDGTYHYEKGAISTDLRISSLPSVYGETMVLRLLVNDRDRELMNIRSLGMDEDQAEAFEDILKTPNGIILVTGPTGSGKSTTLYAGLNQISGRPVNVVTIEDPVEKLIPGITQVQVNPKAGLTFASALRSILRQDPDVIMIGEMRDEETASMGIQAAITGHLVLSTLHTNDSASAPVRLDDMGIPPYLTAASLSCIVAQRLVKLLCPHCRQETGLSDRQKRELARFTDRVPETLWTGKGCEFCRQTGYQKRRAIYEFLPVDETVREMILHRAPAGELRRWQERKGYKNLKDQILSLLYRGETDLEEAETILHSIQYKRKEEDE